MFSRQNEDSASHEKEIGPIVSSVKLTYFLILICVVVGIFESYVYIFMEDDALGLLFNRYGFSTDNFLNGMWWTPITSIFLHGSVDHLIFNIIALYFFGKATEEKLGWKKTLLIFFVAGWAGNLFSLTGSFLGLIPTDIPIIGASAAIFGLMGVSMVMDPLEMVLYPFLVPIPLIFVAVLYGMYNIIAALNIFFGGTSQVAYFAHLGGLAAGGIFGFHEVGLRKALAVLLMIIILVIILPSVLQYISAFDYSGFLG